MLPHERLIVASSVGTNLTRELVSVQRRRCDQGCEDLRSARLLPLVLQKAQQQIETLVNADWLIEIEAFAVFP